MKTLLVALGLLAAASAALPIEQGDVPACVRHWTEVRGGYPGYNHVVHLSNGCAEPADCVVTTNVSPDTMNARVDPKQHIELLTFRGSPAATFQADVTCRLQPKARAAVHPRLQ